MFQGRRRLRRRATGCRSRRRHPGRQPGRKPAGAGLGRVRGPRAQYPGRGKDRPVHRRALRPGRAAARRRRRWLVPAGRAGAQPDRRAGAGRVHHRRRHPRAGPGRGHRGGVPVPAGQGGAGGRAAGVRRLRHHRPGAGLGRLRRPGREGQDRGDPGQRSGFRERPGRFRRQGDDLLRPLDLQVRGSRAARRGRGADRARDRAGGLPVGDRAQRPQRSAVRHRPRRCGRLPPAGARLDPARGRAAAVRRIGAGFRGGEGPGAAARLRRL